LTDFSIDAQEKDVEYIKKYHEWLKEKRLEDKLKADREAHATSACFRYIELRRKGLCTRCRQPVVPGMARCELHRERKNKTEVKE
jgi:hypothetical protein